MPMLATLLGRCRRAEDLPPLFAHLGYATAESGVEGDWHAIARWRTFRVIGATAADPVEAVRTKARRLAATAQPALVAAIGNGTLALAAPRLGTAASSPVLAISVEHPDRLHLQLLVELAPKQGSTALAHALRTDEVLGSETASERFFEAFHGLFLRAQGRVSPRRHGADRALLALLPLTRVLFLYFVQAKGWLDGRTDFLRTALDDALAGRHQFHRSVLHPLFFGTLNRPAAARSGERFGRVPYLNGGLFEPHPAERTGGPLILPNTFWRDAFDQVFERFRFCVREGEQVDAVAPDMLGRTFERLMQSDERQASGTFYTPERLVREVVIATIGTVLERMGASGTEAYEVLAACAPPQGDRRAMIRRLVQLRIADPAAGSGAFLLSTLDVLTTAWTALGTVRNPAARVRLRRRIVARQLFGVDVNPVAVRLAELRLWLALMADDPETDATRVAPLPNLNGIVRQGDTLLDPIGAVRAFGVTAPSTDTGRVAAARRTVFGARGPERADALAVLRNAELESAQEYVADAISQVQSVLRDLLSAARGRDLFGTRVGLSSAARARHRILRAHLKDLRAARQRITHGTVPFFSFEVHHPRVMAAGGFDAVIGNPPWVRAERLPFTLRATLKGRFRWWRADDGRGFVHQPDLAVAFLERAVELARPGGTVGFLLPSKVRSAGYAEVVRQALVRETTLGFVHRIPDQKARGFRASVYPLAVVLTKAAPAPDHRVGLDFRRERTIPQRALAGPGPWILAGDHARRALDELRRGGPPLGVVAPPMLGVKTGADDILLGTIVTSGGPTCVARMGGVEVRLEAAVLRRALRGRDLRAFVAHGDRVVFWPYESSGVLRVTLPPLAARWIRTHRARLEQRSDFRGGPLWTLFRTGAAFGRNRVVWPDLARAPHAVVQDDRAAAPIPLNTCYVSITPDAEMAFALAATLNSTWIRVLLRLGADEARGGYRRHNTRAMSTVPIPPEGRARQRLVVLSRRAHQTHGFCLHDLDSAVATALGLSAATRADLTALADDLG
jgi:hypothetical protein